MDVIKKWVGWILAIAAVLFIIAMYQSGALDPLLEKVHLPTVTVGK